MEVYYCIILLYLFIYNIRYVAASGGNRSPYYQTCVNKCLNENCTSDGVQFLNLDFKNQQDEWTQMMGWDCLEECDYHCMWRTVGVFLKKGYNIPKFHGKWPFKRAYGVQEPASTTASLLNLFAHVYMFKRVVRDRRLSVTRTPLLWFWHIFFAVCVHAWGWSAIFHTRDNPLTELLDYTCAFSMVMAHFVAAWLRIFVGRRVLQLVGALASLLVLVSHAQYLATEQVDYEYNMAVNVFCGVSGGALWGLWSVWQLSRGARYAAHMLLYVGWSAAALTLELLDFPPHAGSWDAHAMWHLFTAPLPLVLYRFVIDDLVHLESTKISEHKLDLKQA